MRSADVIGAAVVIARIATGEIEDAAGKAPLRCARIQREALPGLPRKRASAANADAPSPGSRAGLLALRRRPGVEIGAGDDPHGAADVAAEIFFREAAGGVDGRHRLGDRLVGGG